ncbi:hypothetical protein LZ31DRAFT_301047 [Colletotrichum somersetense]|nr:hypothetical protein LZ31DRAFT_301047 [Colletotrichum somersetense]
MTMNHNSRLTMESTSDEITNVGHSFWVVDYTTASSWKYLNSCWHHASALVSWLNAPTTLEDDLIFVNTGCQTKFRRAVTCAARVLRGDYWQLHFVVHFCAAFRSGIHTMYFLHCLLSPRGMLESCAIHVLFLFSLGCSTSSTMPSKWGMIVNRDQP